MTKTGDPQLGRRIREARRRAHLTQAAVVERMSSAPEGRDHHWLSNIENGAARLRIDDLPDLARALGVSADYLVGLRPPPSEEAEALTEDERGVLQAFRRATSTGRRMMLASVRAIAEASAEYSTERDPQRTRRPRAG